METTLSLEIEVDRQIARLRLSNSKLMLLSVSAPQLPAPILNAAVCATAGRTDLVGTLEDGSVGVLAFLPLRTGVATAYEQRFHARLRVRLLAASGARVCGRAWIRSVHRWSAELYAASDLFDALAAAPRTYIALGLPGPVAAAMDDESLWVSRKHWFNLHAYGAPSSPR
jgi:hypothetical protein